MSDEPGKPLAATFGNIYADAAKVALLAVTYDGQILGYNERFLEHLEVPPRVLASGRIEQVLTWLHRRKDDGSLAIEHLLSSNPTETIGDIALADGRTIGWRKIELPEERAHLWAFEDVSESRQMAAALVDAANWLEMLELHTDGILLELDERAAIVGIWGSTEAFFDQPDSALCGKPLVEAMVATAGTLLNACVLRTLTTESPATSEYACEMHGTRRFFSAKAVLMPTSENGSKRVALMIHDISEQARMQAQLLQSERLASVGLLAAGVAHEINNPLGYILLSLERIRRDLEAFQAGAAVNFQELTQAVEISLDGASRLRAIVRDLTYFCRSEEPERVAVDIHHPLEFAINMAEAEIRPRATIVRDFGPLPPVVANESRLSQLFLNLIMNAAQAIPEGNPANNLIRLVTRTDQQGHAIVEVHDTGMGITSGDMLHIFEPFYTTKPMGSGTGLGLTICQSIVTALQGRIDVDSTVGRGSVFRVLLPSHTE